MMRLQLSLSVARDEEIQYAAGGHPLDGPPAVAPPPGRVAVSGWECVCHDDRGYTWGRRLRETLEERNRRENEERARADAELSAAMKREDDKREANLRAATDFERLAVLREWFPAAGELDRASQWDPPGAVTLAQMREKLAESGYTPLGRVDGWNQLWTLAWATARERVLQREARASNATD